MNEAVRLPVTELILKNYKLAVHTVCSMEFAQEPELKVYADHLSDTMCYAMTQRIMGQPIEDVEIDYPKDWWEAFKDRWFPEWLKRRYPVVRSEHHFTAAILYPQITLPKDQYPQRFYLWDHQSWETKS